MTTYPTLVISKGRYSINLNDRVNTYLRTDFVPPDTTTATQIATGSALNPSGGRVVARKPQTRSWAFSVRLVGSTDAQIIIQVRAIKALLNQAGDPTEPVMIGYKPNSDTPEPLWGQHGARLNYEVLAHTLTIGPDYMKGARRAKAVVATFNLTIQPYATGKQQRLGSALGGIIEDRFGATDRQSRGLIVSEGTTNLVVNPSFENATYLTGWTLYGTCYENRETQIVRNGVSAYRQGVGGPATGCRYIDISGLSVGAVYTFSAYCYVVSGSGLVDASDGGGFSNPVLVAGDLIGQWQRLSVQKTCPASGSIRISLWGNASGEVIWDDVQIERKSYATPYCDGDMLGCAWASAAHASTTTRADGRWKISVSDDTLRFGAWTIRAVLKTPYSNTHPNDWMVFDARDGGHTTAPCCYYIASSDVFGLIYSGNLVQSTGLTFAAGATFVIHAVCTGSTITLYVNGVASSTSASFTPSEPGAALFIGSDYSAASHGNQTTMDLALFDVALNAGEVANDYANIAAVVAADKPLGAVPWLWTKDGDDLVDNCFDSTHNNWCVIGGIAGTAPAVSMISMQLSGYLSSVSPVALSLLDVGRFSLGVIKALIADSDGTADGGSCGGSYESLTVGTSETPPDDYLRPYFKDLAGRTFVLVARVKNAGTGLSMRGWLSIANMGFYTDWKNIPNDTAYRLFCTNELPMVNDVPAAAGLSNNSKTVIAGVSFKRATGSSAIDVDCTQLLVRPLALLNCINPTTTAGIMIVGRNVYTLDQPLIGVATSPHDFYEYGTLIGDPIEFAPGRFNILTSFIGLNSISNPALADAIYYQRVAITPRYDLL